MILYGLAQSPKVNVMSSNQNHDFGAKVEKREGRK